MEVEYNKNKAQDNLVASAVHLLLLLKLTAYNNCGKINSPTTKVSRVGYSDPILVSLLTLYCLCAGDDGNPPVIKKKKNGLYSDVSNSLGTGTVCCSSFLSL